MNSDSSASKNVDMRTLVVSAIGLSAGVWDIAFNLGVHNTIFYSKLQTLWVASTVVLFCVTIAGREDHNVSRWGQLALLSPTIWFVVNAFTPQVNVTWYDELTWLLALGIFVVAIPYILFILVDLVETDLMSLSPKNRTVLMGVVLAVAIIGYLVGSANQYFVSCEQFTLAGDTAPADCASWE